MMCWILIATGNASSPTGFRLSSARGSRCDFTCNMQPHFDIHMCSLLDFWGNTSFWINDLWKEFSIVKLPTTWTDEKQSSEEREKEKRRKKIREETPFGPSIGSLCHLWFTTANLSYSFPIFETPATALRGTTGSIVWHVSLSNNWVYDYGL